MVQTAAATVDDWFAEVDPARGPYLAEVRALADSAAMSQGAG